MKFTSQLGKIKKYLKLCLGWCLITSSRLFDRKWYLEKNPDVAQAGCDPVWHYLNHGGFEGRDPGPGFSSGGYLDTYEDVKGSRINPLVHYLKFGRKEGREAKPRIDLTEDRKNVSLPRIDLTEEDMNLSLIRLSGFFDEALYLKDYPHVGQINMHPLLHYLRYGGVAGLDLAPHFYSRWYLDTYEDVRNSGINPLVHFLKYGREQGYKAHPPIIKLSRMYDYSREKNRIVFWDAPERIYLQRPRIVGSFTGILEQGEALCPPAYVSVIEDAVVFGGSSLVVVQQEYILSDEMMDFAGEEFGIKSPFVKPWRENTVMLEYKEEPSLHIKEGILLSCEHDNNYFHWLMECLPKLVLIDSLDQFKGMPLLILKGLHKNLEAALKRVNINDHPLIYLEPNVAYQVERLVFPSALSRVVDRYFGRPVFDVDIVLSHKWISKVSELLKKDMQSAQNPWRKLFLTRRKGLRAVANLEQLELMLLEQGFEIVDLDGVSLDFQIKLFSQASMIVAPTGAALTNMLFCQSGTKVVILMSNHETTNYYFWSNLGAIMKLDVTIVAGERLFNLTDYWSVHDDYVVDPKTLLDEVRQSVHTPLINRMMSKFFLVTRGRTGSTAVIDELNKSLGLRATQELFLKYDFDKLPDFDKLYDLVLPYDLWKLQKNASPYIENDNDNVWANLYLEETEALARNQMTAGFGFKVLSHHFDESPFLSELLRKRGYQAIYLTRNMTRQVLSGMVSNQSGVWNTREKNKDLRSYHIDLDEFQWKIDMETESVKKDYVRLAAEGFSFIVVTYEEFCADRQSFYAKIFQFLGLPTELPPKSDYSVIIKDLSRTIANYDAVVERAAAIGMPLDS